MVIRPLRTRLFVHVPVVRSPLLWIEMDIIRPIVRALCKRAAGQSHSPYMFLPLYG